MTARKRTERIESLHSEIVLSDAAVNSALFVHGPRCQLRKSLSEALVAFLGDGRREEQSAINAVRCGKADATKRWPFSPSVPLPSKLLLSWQ